MLRRTSELSWTRVVANSSVTHPGQKLLFMGDDSGQWGEWNHDRSLDWQLLEHPLHSSLQRWVRDLNTFYKGQPSLYEVDFEPSGFEWVDRGDFE